MSNLRKLSREGNICTKAVYLRENSKNSITTHLLRQEKVSLTKLLLLPPRGGDVSQAWESRHRCCQTRVPPRLPPRLPRLPPLLPLLRGVFAKICTPHPGRMGQLAKICTGEPTREQIAKICAPPKSILSPYEEITTGTAIHM